MSSAIHNSVLFAKALEIYEPRFIAGHLAMLAPGAWTVERVQRCSTDAFAAQLTDAEYRHLQTLFPPSPPPGTWADFDFIDLFAGIGGMRSGFERAGGRCVLTSEWNPYAVRTYKANFFSDPNIHRFNENIRDLTLSTRNDLTEQEAFRHVGLSVPDHDVLLAGLPVAPFSARGHAAGGSTVPGWTHSLFFDVARILAAKRPAAFVIETARYVAVHDGGRTLRVMLAALEELGYRVADTGVTDGPDPKIVNAVHFVPQHRERLVLAGFRADLDVHRGFTLDGIRNLYPVTRPRLGDILEAETDPRYVLSARLWQYLLLRSTRFRSTGVSPGYSLVGPADVTRPLTARYHMDPADILVDHGPAAEVGAQPGQCLQTQPRRLTPRECARLMGFDAPGETRFRIPVSDTQAYRLFGSASVVPVFAAIAQLMKTRIVAGRRLSASSQPASSASGYAHNFCNLEELRATLASSGAERAIIKVLTRNANDKNQIRLARDFGVLFNDFDMTLAERGESTSTAKGRSAPGTGIPEAVFNDFSWLRRDGTRVRASGVKAIIYTQYPEARLSGLAADDGTMPSCLSAAYVERHPDAERVLVLARLPGGRCLGLVCLNPPPLLIAGINALARLPGATACRRLHVGTGNSFMLEMKLASIAGKPMPGCRLDAHGRTLPFSGTQVCGYTLEHALGIIPNSDKNGDLYGIELKTHTGPKVTLFTPEPDGGLYASDFSAFIMSYGYQDAGGCWRVTGVHRANVRCERSGLTLRVRELHPGPDGTPQAAAYNPATPLTAKFGLVDVALIADDGTVAASWSLERLMNCWGAKHNEVVYVPALKLPNPDTAGRMAGFEHSITFGRTVLWCRDTSAERLLQAIGTGVIYLDPAPKLDPVNPSRNKRRAQWRVSDILTAARTLYVSADSKELPRQQY